MTEYYQHPRNYTHAYTVITDCITNKNNETLFALKSQTVHTAWKNTLTNRKNVI